MKTLTICIQVVRRVVGACGEMRRDCAATDPGGQRDALGYPQACMASEKLEARLRSIIGFLNLTAKARNPLFIPRCLFLYRCGVAPCL